MFSLLTFNSEITKKKRTHKIEIEKRDYLAQNNKDYNEVLFNKLYLVKFLEIFGKVFISLAS